jgi:tetratricopeptide (TPR) repeat protein
LERERAAHAEAERERKLAAEESKRNQYLVRFVLWDVAARLQNNPKVREAVLRRTLAELEQQARSEDENGRFADRGRMSIDLQLGDLYSLRARSQVGADRDKSLATARRHFEQARQTAQQLVDAEPDSPKAKGNLAVVFVRMGSLFVDSKDFAKAKELYDQSLSLRQEVFENPGPRDGPNSLRLADVRSSLANSYGALADLARVQKDKRTALQMLDKAISLVRDGIARVEMDPANTEQSGGIRLFRSDLARYTIISARERIDDKSPDGIRAVQNLLLDSEQLFSTAGNSTDLDNQIDLARLLAQAGDNYLFSAVDAASAKANYQK